MVIVSLKQSEILLISTILSNYETQSRIFEILQIFNKLSKATKSRLQKAAIKDNQTDFKKTNKVRDLGVYKKK